MGLIEKDVEEKLEIAQDKANGSEKKSSRNKRKIEETAPFSSKFTKSKKAKEASLTCKKAVAQVKGHHNMMLEAKAAKEKLLASMKVKTDAAQLEKEKALSAKREAEEKAK